ncbi:MAG: HsdM family class I SAM-dependent methyltransferase [Chloroflexota bacterium]
MIAASPSKRKRLGAYQTPAPLARFLVDWATRSMGDRILEPACGEAVFLEAVVNRLQALGGTPDCAQVVGYELEPEAAARARQLVPNASVIQGDFFTQDPPRQAFDAVVGNPPYVRYHYFAGPARQRGLARARASGVNLTRLASSWAPFIIHAAAFLHPLGRLALVLPGELLSTDYAAAVRQYLVRRFASIDVITFEARVFPEAMVDAVLLLAEGQGPGDLRILRLSDTGELRGFVMNGGAVGTPHAPHKWTEGLLSADSAEALSSATAVMCRLGEVATVDIGIVTGANAFFVLSEVEVQSRELPPDVLRPIVARSTQIRGSDFKPETWEEQRRAGAPVWLFSPRTETEAAGRYIAWGARHGVSAAYKCRVRRPWWKIKLPQPPDLLLSYMSHVAPRLMVNSARVLTTNLIHNVRLRQSMLDDTPAARLLALSWNNSATLLSCEVAGRAYGGGVLKLETREAERVLMPRLEPAQADALLQQAPTIDAALQAGNIEAAADLIDPIVLATLKPAQRLALRSGWADLRARRKRRSVPARSARRRPFIP